MKIKILKSLCVFFATLVLSAVAFRALFISNIQWDYFVCILASLLGISIVSIIVALLADNLGVKTFFKWLSIISFIPIVYFVASIVVIFWGCLSPLPYKPTLTYLYIEIKTNQSENVRTVYYAWNYRAGQKYTIQNDVVSNYFEIPPLYVPDHPHISQISIFFDPAIWDIREKMKPYKWLPFPKKIDKNAPMVIYGRDDYKKNLYWSGAIENAPKGISYILQLFDQNGILVSPTNGMVFVQAIPNNKKREGKKILMDNMPYHSQTIIHNAIRHPYRLQLVNQNDFLGSLVDNFQPFDKSYDVSYSDAYFNIRFIPYSSSQKNEVPPTIFEHNPQGTQP